MYTQETLVLIPWQGTPPIIARPANRAILRVGMMSFAIVFLVWVAASLLFAPVIGRFISMQDQCEGCEAPNQVPARSPSGARIRYGANTSMRRNIAIPLSRRAGSARANFR